VFLFDKHLKKCYGRVDDPEMWRLACFIYDDLKVAAREVGIVGVPSDGIPLRGISPDDARDRQLRYVERKRLEAAGLFVPYHKRRKKPAKAKAKAKAKPAPRR
jgi:hypothetical protein